MPGEIRNLAILLIASQMQPALCSKATETLAKYSHATVATTSVNLTNETRYWEKKRASLIVSGRRWQVMYVIRRPPGQVFVLSPKPVMRHELTRWLFSFLIVRLILWSVHKENAAKQFPTPVDFKFQKSKLENFSSCQVWTYPPVVSFSRGALIGMEEMESRLVWNNTSLKVIYAGKLFSIINWHINFK